MDCRGRASFFGLPRETLVRFARFGIVGASGVGVNVVVFELVFRLVLHDLALDPRVFLANGAGIVVSIFTNFMLNDRWTWGDRVKGGARHWLRRLVKYYLLASVAAAVQLCVTWLSLRVLWIHLPLVFFGYDVSPTSALLTGIACGMVINFMASHLWAFADHQ